MLIYQIVLIMSSFIGHPVITLVEDKIAKGLIFPAITICPQKPFSKTAMLRLMGPVSNILATKNNVKNIGMQELLFNTLMQYVDYASNYTNSSSIEEYMAKQRN